MKRHLGDAPIYAAMRADDLLAEGDLEGAKVLQAYCSCSRLRTL
jgi:hypothetical protein